MKSTVCSRHGKQGIGLVCRHIALAVDERRKVGFFWSDDEDLARPDAWCAECDRRIRLDPDDPDWFDNADFKFFCAACWDEAKQICGSADTP